MTTLASTERPRAAANTLIDVRTINLDYHAANGTVHALNESISHVPSMKAIHYNFFMKHKIGSKSLDISHSISYDSCMSKMWHVRKEEKSYARIMGYSFQTIARTFRAGLRHLAGGWRGD
ncbi:hypothetical protein KDI_19720 [Dictyobacter arantiisoli]|uniref:Uncharacterized protein n=1 Tax=Dictyobacter arantiisoli TaxID=2014874 RepID=A0A5A5TAI5_9CHLR|nr:hypothetical protein KDI_19720 [Dictyobacter arantiisoli]